MRSTMQTLKPALTMCMHTMQMHVFQAAISGKSVLAPVMRQDCASLANPVVG